MPEDRSKIPSITSANAVIMDSQASYLLTGRLGSLKKSVAIWMVKSGARYLIFLSRSAGNDQDKAFFAELETMGCSVHAVAGKVQDRELLNKMILETSKPIKGVIHLAMVLRVCSFIFHFLRVC